MVRYRASLVRIRTLIRNRIHAHLLMYNIKIDASSFTNEYIKTLRELNDYKIEGMEYIFIIQKINS